MSINWESPNEVLNSLVAIYNNQTDDEQNSERTLHSNGIGFNALDAPILSSFAKQLESRGFLSEKQYSLVLELLPKYTKQIGLLEPSILNAVTPYHINTPHKNNSGTLKIVGNKLHFIPNVYPSVQVKQFGFLWNSTIKGWTSPVRKASVEGVLRLFSDIQVDDTVLEFLSEQEIPVELSSTVTESSLFPHQKEATAFELKSRKCLMGMAPGTGKTASAIFAANELNYPRILVICPLSLVYLWKKEINKWIGKDAVIWHGNVSNWEAYDKWVITNYDTAVRNVDDILNQNFKVVIMDESILLKNRKTVRSKAMKQIAKSCDYTWLLSGSPISKFYDDMWSQLNIIDPTRFRSYWSFAENYCYIDQNYWGTTVGGNLEDASDRIKKDLSDVYFCRTLDEVLDIPEWIFDTLPIPMSKSQYKLYEQMENEFLADLPDGDQLLSPNVLSQMTRLVQIASNPLLIGGDNDGAKWKASKELIEIEEKPLILWTNFIHTAQLMASSLQRDGYRVASLTGETPTKSRQDIVDEFQNGDLDIIVAHPAVGKFGLTLTRARTAIYMERSFNGDDYYQSLYRIRRIGTTQSPHVIHLVAVRPENKDGNTIDGVIDRVLDYRKNSSIEITSGMIRDLLGK